MKRYNFRKNKKAYFILLISFKNYDSLKNSTSRNLDKFMNSVAIGYITKKQPIIRCMPLRSNTLGNHTLSLNAPHTTIT